MIVLKCSELYSLVLAVHKMKNIYTVHTQVRMNVLCNCFLLFNMSAAKLVYVLTKHNSTMTSGYHTALVQLKYVRQTTILNRYSISLHYLQHDKR